jgi:alkyl hydroperoxide reductase subunit AhpC
MVVVRGGGMYEENENRESKERTTFIVERENEINHIIKKT